MTKRKRLTQPTDESDPYLELPEIKTKENQTNKELPKVKRIVLAAESRPRTAIPIGPRYQADVPDWTGSRNKQENEDWLGEQIWPIKNPNQEANNSNGSRIGKGRPGICSCWNPGSAECVNRHVKEKRNKLKSELGEAFGRWKFDEMGEEVSKSWTSKDQKRFESLVENSPSSQGKSFLKAALKSFRGKDRKSIVSYYFNVFVLRQMSKEIKSRSTQVETDDEDEDSEREKPKLTSSPIMSANETRKCRYLTRLR